jgi:hypothetical protein
VPALAIIWPDHLARSSGAVFRAQASTTVSPSCSLAAS